MRHIITTILILLLSITVNAKHEIIIDSRLAPYVNEFIEDCKLRNINIDRYLRKVDMIYVGDNPYDRDAIIGYWFNRTNTIQISPKIIGDTVQLKATVYHELGHALFGFQHICGVPNLIMNSVSTVEDIQYFKDYWDCAVDEFFNYKDYKDYLCNRKNIEYVYIYIYVPVYERQMPNHPPFIHEE